MTPNLVALAAGFCILPLIIGGGMFFNGMRDDRRLAARFADLHRPHPIRRESSQATGELNLRAIAIRLVSGIGDWVLNRGLLSAATREAVETMLQGAGHSGTAALRLFVGTKILLLLLLPAGAWLLADHFGLIGFNRIVTIIGAIIAGMLAPDFDHAKVAQPAHASASRMSCRMPWT